MHAPTPPWIAGLLASAALALAGCRAPAQLAPKPWNVLLVSIDTLRADHLACYGYARVTSPHLDAFAGDGIRYATTLAPTPWTLPSHAALLTGRHPFELGVLDAEGVLPKHGATLAERFRRRGYSTRAFVDSDAGGFLGSQRGFDRGFQSYHESNAQSAERTVSDVMEWLEDPRRAAPFFVFMHTKSVHATAQEVALSAAPYDKPPRFRDRFLPAGMKFPWREGPAYGVALLRRWNDDLDAGRLDKARFTRAELEELQALYDGGIAYVDQQIGRLLAGLRRLGLEQSTVVAITSDHGEAFLEHHFLLHQELTRGLLEVPLLVRVPGGPRGRVVTAPAQLEEVAATLIQVSGADGRPPGLRMLPELGGSSEPRPHFAFYRFKPKAVYEAWGVQDGGFKLILDKRVKDAAFNTRLFDLRHDPREEHPVDEPARRAALLQGLVGYFEPQAARERGAHRMSPEALERLRGLGYVP